MFRKLRSSKEVKILQIALVCFQVVELYYEKIFFHGGNKELFFPYFHYEIIFCCTELFECTFNFKFCQNIFIFLNINTNQTLSKIWILWEAATYFGKSYWEVSWKLMSTSKLSDLQLYRRFWGFWSHLFDLHWKFFWNFKSRKDLSIYNWF